MIKVKRAYAVFIVLCILLTFAPVSAFAQSAGGVCGENVNWSYDFDGHLSISGTGYMRPYTQASEAPWYRFSDELVSVSIEPGVKSIGDYAFFWCDKITSAAIPSSVTSIGSYAFYSCKALTGMEIPDGTTSIGDHAFANCGALTSVSIPGSVTSIGDCAFDYCTELTSVEIPESVKIIGERAFYLCGKLEDITINGAAASIGNSAFESTAYYYDDSKWENGVLYIGKCLIAANQDISGECIVKSETKTIADYAFFACENLTYIMLPDGIEHIGDHAFNSCKALTGMEIPDSVMSIGSYAFYSCIGLTDISVDEGNIAYCSENGILYNKTKTEIIRFPSKKSDASFAIPDGITSIADGAFSNCRNLTSITIPNGVKNIGNDAFSICFGLTSVTIPDGVTSIGSSAFYNCFDVDSITGAVTGLTSVTIPNSVESIGKYAFLNCKKLNKVNYIGSKDDWKNIIKGEKYSIADNIIKYCAGIKVIRYDAEAIVVEPLNIDTGKTVVLALYDVDKFVEMQQSGEYSETNKEIIFIPTKAYTRAKVMIWEKLESMIPVCGIKTVKYGAISR